MVLAAVSGVDRLTTTIIEVSEVIPTAAADTTPLDTADTEASEASSENERLTAFVSFFLIAWSK